MTGQQLTEAVVDWVRAEIPALQAGYAAIPDEFGPLPDVVVEIEQNEVTDSHPDFPLGNIQQFWLDVYAMGVSIMVSNANTVIAAEFLRDCADTLKASLRADATLGGRVPLASPRISFDHTPPFVERSDGTRGREMTAVMTVAQPAQEE